MSAMQAGKDGGKNDSSGIDTVFRVGAGRSSKDGFDGHFIEEDEVKPTYSLIIAVIGGDPAIINGEDWQMVVNKDGSILNMKYNVLASDLANIDIYGPVFVLRGKAKIDVTKDIVEYTPPERTNKLKYLGKKKRAVQQAIRRSIRRNTRRRNIDG